MPEFLRRVARLVPHFINTTTFAARDFRPRRGASNDVWAEKNRRPQGRVAFRFWRCCSSVIPTGRDGGCSLVAPSQNRKATQQTWSYLQIGPWDWLHSVPLTPALSLGERENGPPPLDHNRGRVCPTTIGRTLVRSPLFPL